MALDIGKMTSRIKGKAAAGKPAAAEPDADDKGGMSPGKMALAAIKNGDAAALEEAIRRCVDEGY